ncbi:hypothetical protein [Pedobacter sp. ASV12]|uniref:hypothetical protein n=1 Tax=Pedobacter sp. ASV12 TaxID=2795120 RepID=UPI0018EBD7C1|nr:hypothetical protein [Pedobacter sp. ASV12]
MDSLEDFYQQIGRGANNDLMALLPEGINKEIGHFNVFDTNELFKKRQEKAFMPYNRRAYYKISLINGRNRAEYADKVIDIEQNALLFATPKIPYHWLPQDDKQAGRWINGQRIEVSGGMML